MVSRIYKEDHYTLLHTKYESSGPCGFGEDLFYIFPMTPPGGACIDPRDTVGRVYKENHYALLHTKYESSGLVLVVRRGIYFYVFPIVKR